MNWGIYLYYFSVQSPCPLRHLAHCVMRLSTRLQQNSWINPDSQWCTSWWTSTSMSMCFQERNPLKAQTIGSQSGQVWTIGWVLQHLPTDCTATIHRHVHQHEENNYATPLTSYAMSHGHLCRIANFNFSIDDTSIQNWLQTHFPSGHWKKCLTKRTAITFHAVNVVLNFLFEYKIFRMLAVIIAWCIHISAATQFCSETHHLHYSSTLPTAATLPCVSCATLLIVLGTKKHMLFEIQTVCLDNPVQPTWIKQTSYANV